MKLDEAVDFVTKKTGEYTISAFEFEGTFYVQMTPLSDYDSEEDVVSCYYPVTNGKIGEPINALGLFLSASNPDGIADAAKHAKSYLSR